MKEIEDKDVDKLFGIEPEEPDTEEDDTEEMDDDRLQSIVKLAITQAIDFVDSEIAPERRKAQRYYDGEVDIGHECGTSSVVSTKVRDTIRTILPNLMRIFLASEHPAEFLPKKQEDVQMAKEATDFIAMEFDRLNGFELLNDAMLDSLVKKVGFIKAYWDEKDVTTSHRYTNLTDQELELLYGDEGVEIEDQETVQIPIPKEFLPPPQPVMGPNGQPQMGPDGQPVMQPPAQTSVPSHNCTVKKTKKTGSLVMESIPPEDFFIDSGASCLHDAYVYGHQSDMRVADLVEMGFDFDEMLEVASVVDRDLEDDSLDDAYSDDMDTTDDESMRLVTVTEAFIRVDMEGDGKAVRHRFLCAGADYKILEHEEWTGECIAVFEQDPIPHCFFGNSIADLLFNDQDAATSMLRGILNNIALTNTPRSEVNDDLVNMDDMMNNEIGGFVRVKQMGMINPLAVPFIAGETLGAVQYFDGRVEAKTGVNSVSSGLSPDVLQNQTATAVTAAVSAGTNTIESIARNLARGYVALFKIMLRLLVENSDEEVMMRLMGGEFVMMDPRSWNTEMEMRVNVGLGTGREDQKLMALQMVIAAQEKLMMAQSPMVGPDNIRNTLADMLSISGIKAVDRYFKPVDPNAPPQQQPDPNAAVTAQAQAIVEAEKIKAQAKLQADKYKTDVMATVQKYIADQKAQDANIGHAQKGQQYSQELDLERDKMAQQLYVDLASILGQYGASVDVAAVKQAQAAPRGPDGTPVERSRLN